MGIIGGDVLTVNGSAAQTPYQSDIVTLADGGFVLVWSGDATDDASDVKLRVFNADGSLRSTVEIPVAAHAAGSQTAPKLTALANGGFVVAWSGATATDDAGIAFRVFDAEGTATGAFDLPANAAPEGLQSQPLVTTLADGGVVTAWRVADGAGTGLALRIFEKDGSIRAGTQEIRLDAAAMGDVQLTALAGGGFVVVHDGMTPDDTAGGRVRMRIFDAEGTPARDAVVPLNGGNGGIQHHPVVRALADGGFVVAWDGERQGDGAGVALQIYDADGTARANCDVEVNAYTAGEQRRPIVTALKDGGFVVLWTGATWHDADGLAMQVYNADGKTRVAGDIPVNVGTGGVQGNPFVAALSGGGFAVAWTTKDAGGYSIALRTFNADGTARMASETPIGAATALPQGSPQIAALEDGSLALTWQVEEEDGVHIYEKVFHEVNDAPTGSSSTRYIEEDGVYTFKVTDFGFADVNGDGFKAIRIGAVPVNGILTLDGQPVVPGQEIKASHIAQGALVWTAAANLNGTALATLSFNVIDTGGTSFGGRDIDPITRKITLDVDDVNDAPVAKAISGATYENALYRIEVQDAAVDVDDDKLALINAKIVSGFGSVMIDAKKMLVYNPMIGPNQNIGAGDTRKVVISYSVSDGRGGTTTATITLTVNGISPDIFSGTGNSDRLSGSIHGDLMYGKAGNDTIAGGRGNDLLDGGSGTDTLKGESGDDTYLVDCSTDVVSEAANAGTDTVQADCSYVLRADVEKLALMGSRSHAGTGNALANTIAGNAGANVLKGLDGNDRLSGGAGNDRLEGGGGGDTLDGGAGSDGLSGGAGNDVYIVDTSADKVVEARGEGTDTVQAAVSHTLSDNVEKLVLTGTGGTWGTGNALSNAIAGNAGANTLKGLAGNDRLLGGAGNDRLDGGDGNDTLDGGTGTDRLYGGTGDDVYLVDGASDRVIELRNGGTDTVQAGCSHTLAAHVERLLLTGSGNDAGTGNTGANGITGNSGANLLKGLDGNDTLEGGRGSDRLYGGNGADTLKGGAGADRLSGGTGSDVFVFRNLSESSISSTGRDTVVDFSSRAGDMIDLRGIDAREATNADNAFTFIGKAGFDKHAGELRYARSGANTLLSGDVDGDGKADFAILFAGNIAFTKGDFLL